MIIDFINNKILCLSIILIIFINKSSDYGNNNVYANDIHVINFHNNQIDFEYLNKKKNYLVHSIKNFFSKTAKDLSCYKNILIFGLIYYTIATYYDRMAKKIKESDFYVLFTHTDFDELPLLLKKISNNSDFDFIVKMKKIKKEIDFFFHYRYFIYFFIAFPFFHGTLKRVMINISKLYNSIKLLNNLIINKEML
jgi:hypothetical protein